MNVRIPEQVRAWAWHLLYWVAAGVALLALIWVTVWTIHLAGAAIGLTLLVVAVVVGLATITWWASERQRP